MQSMDFHLLHYAVLSNDAATTRRILSQNLVNVNIRNKVTGDQASHIAARNNCIDCMNVLIDYDVDMDRRNWNGLTPCGEARMNGHIKIVQLIKERYCKQEHESKWDNMIENMAASWEETWDLETYSKVWVRKYNGEIIEKSTKPPSMDVDFIIAARDYQHKTLIRKDDPNDPDIVQSSYSQLKISKYTDERTNEQKIIERLRIEKKLSSLIRNLWKGHLARKLRRRKELEFGSLISIQRWFKACIWK